MFKASKFPSISSECHRINVIDTLVWKIVTNYDSNDPLKHCILNDRTTKEENFEVPMCAQFLKASSQVPPTLAKGKTLMSDEKLLSDVEHAQKVELKPLTSSLRYEFVSLNSTCHVIANVSLSAFETDSSLRVLRM